MLLMGCSKEEEVTYEMAKPTGKIQIQFKAKGDQVYEQKETTWLSYDALAVLTEQEAKAKMAERAVDYQELAGVDYHVTYQGEDIIEEVTINYHQADLERLAQKKIFYINVSNIKNGISLKGTSKMLEESGAKKAKSN